MSETIMERLRNETKTAHQQLEKATIPYIKKATNEEQYAYLLKMFYGYFKPVEERIQSLVGEDLLGDISERRQTSAILADLKTIGADSNELLVSELLPNLGNVSQAIGALYVLEGSTLGGRFISQMLMKQLNRSAEDGISFFSGYGANTDAKWKAFTEMVNEYAQKFPEKKDEIVAAADETFANFGRWVVKYEENMAQPA
jgi:heme oxygenase